jgi:hypothetical protein
MIDGGSLTGSSLPALSTTVAAQLCTVPPGVGAVVISNTCGATVFVTAGVAATQTNGFAIPNNAPPVTIPTFPGSKGTTLSVIVITAGTINGAVSWFVSSAQ